MRFVITSFIALLVLTSTAFAEDVAPPAISKNVHIMRNTTPAQCPASWEGQASTEMFAEASGMGLNTGIPLVGVQSCSHCAYDSKTSDCICATCYGYFN